MNLQSIIGQDAIVRQLLHLMQTKSSGHAYAFSGPDGMGKETIARAFAAHLLCEVQDIKPCGNCRPCKMVASGNHPDFQLIVPDPEKDSIRIDEIRLMQSHLQIKPLFGKKIVLIIEADKMNESAQNCLLKTLEDPPENTMLLMTVCQFDKLLSTIRSRVIRMSLVRYAKEDLLHILKKQGIQTNHLYCIHYADGIPGRAVSLLSNPTLADSREKAFATLPGMPNSGYALGDLHALLSGDRQRFGEIIDILMTAYRDMMFLREGVVDGLINVDKRDMIERAVLSCSAEIPLQRILMLDDWKQQLQENMNYQLCVDGLVAVIGN